MREIKYIGMSDADKADGASSLMVTDAMAEAMVDSGEWEYTTPKDDPWPGVVIVAGILILAFWFLFG